jgi:hypothetical protein
LTEGRAEFEQLTTKQLIDLPLTTPFAPDWRNLSTKQRG